MYTYTLTGGDNEPLREVFLSDLIEPQISLRIWEQDLLLNYGPKSVNVPAEGLRGDCFYDRGNHHLMWGDSDRAVLAGTSGSVNYAVAVMCLGALSGDATGVVDDWAARNDINDMVAMTAAGVALPTCRMRCRVGMRGNWVYYVNEYDHLRTARFYGNGTRTGNVIAFVEWGDEADTGGDLNIPSGSGLGVAPVSDDLCFILGYTDPVLWVCAVERQANGSPAWVWVPKDKHVLALSHDFRWEDATNIDAEPSPSAVNEYILAVPTAPGGQMMSIIYNADTETFSQPFFVLATPGGDWLRRVWVSGLTTSNGRVWGVVQTDLGGGYENYYAGHDALVSTRDGRSWRDEGYLHEAPVRGRLVDTQDTLLWIYGPSSDLFGSAIRRISGDVGWVTPSILDSYTQIEIQHPGLNATMQLTAGGLPFETEGA